MSVDSKLHQLPEGHAWVQRLARSLVATAVIAVLSACGGSNGSGNGDGAEQPQSSAPPTGTDAPASREAAARFLTQASFGPNDASVQRVMDLGYSQWIDEQLRKPASSHQANWQTLDAVAKTAAGATDTTTIGGDGVTYSFWRTAVAGDDQLRQRVAFALSQIFVISLQDGNVGNNPRAVANYFDMLATKGVGNYRDLLEGVSLHPMMGMYLSSLGNRKADPKTGRVPDENYAREVMQLFSIGLLQLNMDGSVKMNGSVPVESYTPADIAGLAKVFTGWSWACPVAPSTTTSTCFSSGSVNGQSDPERTTKPMINYPQYHSPEEKKFLTAVIPAGTDGKASLKTALDTLANHPNVGPFLGKQLIQRLVTSNPSPAYVSAVAKVFNDNGEGVRGDMKALVKAILTHPEARTLSTKSGKVREPVLRLSALMRAFNYKSDSGYYKIGTTDSPTQLGQTVMRSPTVFNFYRPGYVPPGSATEAAKLEAPELQISHETTAAGYVNFMRDTVSGNIGQTGGSLNRRDVQIDYGPEMALADKPSELVARVNAKLMYGTMPAALKTLITDAVTGITIPPNGTPTQIDGAKHNRVNAAIFLTLVSPEFQVQR